MKEFVASYPKTLEAYAWASMQGVYNDEDKGTRLEYAQKLAIMGPKFAPNLNTMGHLKMQLMNKAKVAFEKHIALAPKEPNAYDCMGKFYAITKDYAKSAEYYDKAAKMGLLDANERANKAREMMKQE